MRRLSLDNASLGGSLVYQLQLGGAKVIDLSSSKLIQFKVNDLTGAFSGIATNANKTKIPFQGVLRKAGAGGGFFRYGGQRHKVILDKP